MASQTAGIQQLLAAEKKAAEKINEARKRKAKRLKQANDEAKAEIEKCRQDRERQFREYETKHLGSKDDIQQRIENDTRQNLERMQQSVNVNKEKVIQQLLELVCDVQPKIHHNLRK
uniref:V-type proton ATPase subunit G n=1 Tax=Prionchulus punctatus TaxID=293874 RepID=D9ZDB2_9BILA|nr:vacuolar H ATPase [Prionchulus punctatus]ADK34014.1 vacuolar H ATPase [Prionchulus punctatus]